MMKIFCHTMSDKFIILLATVLRGYCNIISNIESNTINNIIVILLAILLVVLLYVFR